MRVDAFLHGIFTIALASALSAGVESAAAADAGTVFRVLESGTISVGDPVLGEPVLGED